MTRTSTSLLALTCALLLASCGSGPGVKGGLTGSAANGTAPEPVPPSMTYNATPQMLRQATLAVLAEQGYAYEEDAASGTLKTGPKALTDTSPSRDAGTTYQARLAIQFEGSTISYRARFDRQSGEAIAERDIEDAETENALRGAFFSALDNKVLAMIKPVAAPSPPPPPVSTAADSAANSVSTEPMSVAEMQKLLLSLGYQPGPVDGVPGKRTVAALKKFQLTSKLRATGKLDAETTARLRVASVNPAR